MSIICPTVTAKTDTEYQDQIEKLSGFASRVQIDLMDGQFAPVKSVQPKDIWWPAGWQSDIHLMFSSPLRAVKSVLAHEPNLVIVHAEADGDFEEIYKICKHKNVKVGVALLAATKPEIIKKVLTRIDHVLIFSGNLGHQGGSYADLSLLQKVDYLKSINPALEIGWDGGINERIVSELVFGGVDVLNVGGYIQSATNPEKAYNTLFRIAEETGTT